VTRGHPPYVAISEAGRKAKARGWLVLVLEPVGELPFHFVICDRDCISLVRVCRLKYPGYGIEEIEESCKNDIAALRSIPITEEIYRELWVRGPDRHWYRYLVLPDSLVVIEDDDLPDLVRPDDIKPDSVKPEDHEPIIVKPGIVKLDDNEPDIIKPQNKEPDSIEPDVIELNTTESESNEPPESGIEPPPAGIVAVDR
jgi:hypothetical protein